MSGKPRGRSSRQRTRRLGVEGSGLLEEQKQLRTKLAKLVVEPVDVVVPAALPIGVGSFGIQNVELQSTAQKLLKQLEVLCHQQQRLEAAALTAPLSASGSSVLASQPVAGMVDGTLDGTLE